MSALVIGAMTARSGVWTKFSRMWGMRRRIATTATSLALGVTLAPSLGTAAEPEQPQYGWREVWGGADATRDVWLLYTGVTIAPWSDDIYSNGWRLRSGAGYGQYRLSRKFNANAPCGNPGQDQCRSIAKDFDISFTYSDALVGYHQRWGELTAKAFVGVAMLSHAVDDPTGLTKLTGTEVGPKGVLEFWLNLGPQAWTSLDLNYTTAHETGSARWRAGWRALPTLSIGPEVRYDSNAEDDAGRAGLFARYEWFGGEASLAGGIAGDMTGNDNKEYQPYATFNLLFQY